MRIRGIIILLLVAFSLSAQQKSAGSRELERQRKSLLAEIESINQLLNENRKSITSILSNLNLILQQIDARKKLVAVLEKEIHILDEEIRSKEIQVKKLDEDLQQKRDHYALSVRKLYQQNNNQGQLLFVLSANNPAQSFRRMLYLREYADWRKQQAETIIARQQQIMSEKQALLVDKKAKEELADAKKIEEGRLHEEENIKKTEMDGLQKNAKKLELEIDKKRKQTSALDREIKKIIAEEIAKANKAAKANPQPAQQSATGRTLGTTKEEQALSSNFAGNKGKLPFPLTGTYKIVGRFGEQQYGDLKNLRYNSNGIDIKTASGNNAKAVFDGEVTRIVAAPGLPLTVVIRHGRYLTIYSGLEQLSVKQGDIVKTGQNIGKIYTDANNETVLHFELWEEQTKQNPTLWLNSK